jgi:CheY-like chemotaxis protein
VTPAEFRNGDPPRETARLDPWQNLDGFLDETSPQTQSPPGNRDAEWKSQAPPRVLLAHADEVRRGGLAWELGAGGCTVIEVEDGKELLDYLDTRDPWGELPRPDVIVTELDMPGCGGLEAAKQLRAMGVETPIVFINVSVSPTAALQAARLPGIRLVEGEIEGGVLRAAVENALRR